MELITTNISFFLPPCPNRAPAPALTLRLCAAHAIDVVSKLTQKSGTVPSEISI